MSTDTTTDLTTYDDAMAAMLKGMVRKEDTTGASIPILRINYEEDMAYPKGVWIVGQTKDKEGVITDEGKEVVGVVILTTRNRFSYYVKGDTAKNCSSPMHVWGDEVKGGKYGYVCGPTCPNRAKGLNPRCKAQKVIFGVAITKEGQSVDCMMYVQGETYVPFTDFYKLLTRKKMKAGYMDIPPFCYLTKLASEKKKQADSPVPYFVGEFSQGPMFSMEQIQGFEARREQATGAIDSMNRNYNKSDTSDVAETKVTAAIIDEPPFEMDDIPAFVVPAAKPAAAKKAATETIIETSAVGVSEADSADMDIEAAIAAALGK